MRQRQPGGTGQRHIRTSQRARCAKGSAAAEREVGTAGVDRAGWQAQGSTGHQADGLVGAHGQGRDGERIHVGHTDGAAIAAAGGQADGVEVVGRMGQGDVTITSGSKAAGTACRDGSGLGDGTTGIDREVAGCNGAQFQGIGVAQRHSAARGCHRYVRKVVAALVECDCPPVACGDGGYTGGADHTGALVDAAAGGSTQGQCAAGRDVVRNRQTVGTRKRYVPARNRPGRGQRAAGEQADGTESGCGNGRINVDITVGAEYQRLVGAPAHRRVHKNVAVA